MDQEEESVTSNEWELCKENVLPLRQGRKIYNLTAALQPNDPDHHLKLQEQKRIYEAEIMTYKGNDPLSIWIEYIKWIEQNFPKGGKEANLSKVIECCLLACNKFPQYFDDARYLDIWLKYISFCKDVFEIFKSMHSRNICHKMALFYENWAWEYEKVGNIVAANKVLMLGINSGAQPLEHLKHWQSKFDARISQRVIENNDVEVMDTEEQRTVLGGLKPIGKKGIISSQRTGSAKLSYNSGLNNQVQIHQKMGPAFQIHKENLLSDDFLYCSNQQAQVTSTEVVSKENERKPETWNHVKVRQKGVGLVPLKDNSDFQKPSFTILEDENTSQPLITPHKVPETCQVLSARKLDKPSDPLAPFKQNEAENPNLRSAYCKDKLYNGLQEISFEELRAFRYAVKKKKEDEKNAQRRFQQNVEKRFDVLMNQMIELQKELRMVRVTHKDCSMENAQKEQEVHQRLKEVHEETQILNALLLNEGQESLLNNDFENHVSDSVSKPQESDKSLHLPVSRLINTGPVMQDNQANTFVTDKKVQGVNHSLFGSESNVSSKNMLTDYPSNVSIYQKTNSNQEKHIMLNSSNNNINDVLQIPGEIKPKQRIEETNSMLSRSNPSPTIMTKEAIGIVEAVWWKNTTFGLNPNKTICNEDKQFEDLYAADDILNSQSSNNVLINDANNYIKLQPFEIYQDTTEDIENRPPKNYFQPTEKRKIVGVLEPSKDIPFQPLNDKENFVATSDQNEELDDIIPQPDFNNGDFTIVPPANQKEFSDLAKHVSTPYNPAMFILSSGVDDENISQNDVPLVRDVVPRVNEAKLARPSLTTGTYTDLSPILETSRDCKISSSSSSSSTGQNGNSHHNPSNGCASQISSIVDEFHEMSLSNPFHENVQSKILSSLCPPLSSYPGYVHCFSCLPFIQQNRMISLGDDELFIKKLIGKGAYAKIYGIYKSGDTTMMGSETEFALKVQKSACPWEFYITSQIRERLLLLNCPKNILSSVLHFETVWVFDDGSCLLSPYFGNGTLLDMVNLYKKLNRPFDENIVMLLTIEILQIVEYVHKCKIIHGDIKPDNFLLQNISSIYLVDGNILQCKGKLAVLIDFGRSIDMALLSPHTTFTYKVTTSGFQCLEMKTNRPWTYQTDIYGILGTVHCMLFGDYMKVYQEAGRWKITSPFKRFWSHLWRSFFDDLLNIPDCDHIPDLASYREKFENHLLNEDGKSLERAFSSLIINLSSFGKIN